MSKFYADITMSAAQLLSLLSDVRIEGKRVSAVDFHYGCSDRGTLKTEFTLIEGKKRTKHSYPAEKLLPILRRVLYRRGVSLPRGSKLNLVGLGFSRRYDQEAGLSIEGRCEVTVPAIWRPLPGEIRRLRQQMGAAR
jgi:hypothetical protein